MGPDQLARRFECHARAIGIPGVTEIGRYRYAAAYEGLRPGAHPHDLEICFLARGQQTYRVKREIRRLRGGDQHIVFPGEPHDSADMPEEKGELYWLSLRLKPAGTPLLFLEPAAVSRLRRALLALPSRHFAAAPGTRDLLEKIIASLPSADDRLARLATATLILRYLFQTLDAAHRNRASTPSPRIQRCLAHIAAHLGDTLSVPQLARLVRLSPSRFKVRFRAETGLPPREYVLRQKIAAAEAALRAPQAKVTAVAHALGFSSSQYFATVFRRFTGRAPTHGRA